MHGNAALVTRSRVLIRGAAAVAAAGALPLTGGFITNHRQAAFSYLAAYAFWLSLALGSLVFIQIHHTINSSWFVVLRRPAEAVAGTLPILALLFLPVVTSLPELYPWSLPGAELPTLLADEIGRKREYLNVPFFLVRSAAYFVIWISASWLLRRWSIRQDAGDGEAIALRQRTFSAVMLPPVAFALTFAAFDWMMSLTPEWSSTIYGVYFFAGAAIASLSLLAIAAHALLRTGALEGMITASHLHALGKLMLAFLIFWAYVGFAQFLLIWIADLPREVGWYLARARGGWGAVGGVLVVGHFFVPLCALLSRGLKRRSSTLAVVGAWLLLMHYVDVYWLVLPALHPAGFRPHWLDFAALTGIGGTVVAWAARLLVAAPLLPTGDPRLQRSLDFVTS
ncbi:MAG TPA: hypothetical protein VNZ57_02645 [Longimicrobiales bacterium]|nr:hypothetical protein [Longimicrobiales bacterium]